MQQTARFSRTNASRKAGFGIRLNPVLNLLSGDTVGMMAGRDLAYEDAARFGLACLDPIANTPQNHVVSLIADAAALSRSSAKDDRPIHVPVPLTALTSRGFAAACRRAAERSCLCPQELVLDVVDSAIFHRNTDVMARLYALHGLGFRIGIDARQTWDAPHADGIGLLVERITIRGWAIEHDRSLEDSIEAASNAGVEIIAERPYWRDGPWLADLGVTCAINPRRDA
ncbi:MAG: EAL domain-containing protein [Pseudomonadota bacterium]